MDKLQIDIKISLVYKELRATVYNHGENSKICLMQNELGELWKLLHNKSMTTYDNYFWLQSVIT